MLFFNVVCQRVGVIISANGTKQIGGDYEIGRFVRVYVCVSVCVHDSTNSASSNAGCYINLSPLQRSGSSFSLLFSCVYITSLGGDMHSNEFLLVLKEMPPFSS